MGRLKIVYFFVWCWSKYLDVGELQQKYDQLNKEKQENFVASEIQSLTNNDKIESQKLEMEAQKYLKYAIKAS